MERVFMRVLRIIRVIINIEMERVLAEIAMNIADERDGESVYEGYEGYEGFYKYIAC
jgi:hypothetical protein